MSYVFGDFYIWPVLIGIFGIFYCGCFSFGRGSLYLWKFILLG